MKLKPPPGTTLGFIPFGDISVSRILQFFQMPLVVELKAGSGEVFLATWHDCDDTTHRWLYVTTSLRAVEEYIARDRTIREILLASSIVYVVDKDVHATSVSMVERSQLPEDYFPEAESYFDQASSGIEGQTYSVFLDRNWSIEQFSAFPRLFRDLYSLVYSSIQKHIAPLRSFPFRGGWSSTNAFNDLAWRVPFEIRPDIDAVSLASPGFIRFTSDPAVGDLVATLMADYTVSREEIKGCVAEIRSFIRQERLNADDRPPLTLHQVTILAERSRRLCGHIDLDWRYFESLAGGAFEGAKLLVFAMDRAEEVCKLMAAHQVRFHNAE